MALLPPAQKLLFHRTHGRAQPFADLYRFGDAGPGAPLILYVGGAIGRQEYAVRRTTAPDVVAHELARALERVPVAPVALLVCPCPIDIGGPDGFLAHYDDELLPAIGGEPAALGCVGYSVGTLFASYVAVLSGARAAALVAAAGMVQGAETLRPFVEAAAREKAPLPAIALYRNAGDRVDDPLEVRRRLRGLDVTVGGDAPGAHPFSDYAANGTMATAFRFVLEHMTIA
jgi:hypothetical protein